MPANLNALIRYKTINSCLYGGKRRWSIDELRKRCSEALAENRGRYTDVSERTIRDDLRVMRSDILGFNAPIRQEGGLYFYSDPEYSIMSLRITDAELAEQIYDLLMKLRVRVSHPELEIILRRLCGLLDKEYEPVTVEMERIAFKRKAITREALPELDAGESYNIELPSYGKASRSSQRAQLSRQVFRLLWGDVIRALSPDIK